MSNDATGIDSCPIVASHSSELAEANLCGFLPGTGIRLKSIRDAFGFSQRELAKRAGVTNSSISMIEQEQVSPSIQSLARILGAFPISLADFFSFNVLSVEADPHPVDDIVIRSLISTRQLDARIEHLLAGQCTAFSAPVVDSCGVVITGNLQLTLLSGNQLLKQGDSFYIPASHLFRLINLSEQDASVFCCSLFAHKG
jgi:transcriptional regulator with XRE-family HTH domain